MILKQILYLQKLFERKKLQCITSSLDIGVGVRNMMSNKSWRVEELKRKYDIRKKSNEFEETIRNIQ